MEIAVIQDNTSRCIRLSQSQLITKYQLKIRIASEVAFHLYASINWRVDHVSRWVEKDVDFLVNVNENLICVVFAYWNRGSGRVDGIWAEEVKIVADFFEIQHTSFDLFDFACDKRFDMWGVGQLRMAEVDDLV